MRNWFLLSLSLPLGLASLPAAAGGASDELQTIVVTATRIPTPQSQIASSITVITAEDIAARQEQSLPDALKEVPGLNLVQSGGPGGQTSVFMRGTNSNHTKVLVDGIDLSDPSNPTGAFDFAHFLMQDIQKIEVLRGPQSGLYGSDAIGGVVNIITKSGNGPAQLTRQPAGRLLRHLQPGGQPRRFRRPLPLHVQRRPHPLGRDPGDPARAAAAGRAAHR